MYIVRVLSDVGFQGVDETEVLSPSRSQIGANLNGLGSSEVLAVVLLDIFFRRVCDCRWKVSEHPKSRVARRLQEGVRFEIVRRKRLADGFTDQVRSFD